MRREYRGNSELLDQRVSAIEVGHDLRPGGKHAA
jgi:hypothetical protein